MEWQERVDAWRASGQTAEAFGNRNGFKGKTLRWWASELRQRPRFARVIRKGKTDVPSSDELLVIEIAGARIAVRPGFSSALLKQVVAALGGAQ